MDINYTFARENFTPSNQLYFYHDRQGRILEFASNINTFTSEPLKTAIQEKGGLSPLFTLEELGNSRERHAIPQNPDPVLTYRSTGMLSLLPLSVLYTRMMEDGRFFGHLTLCPVFPEMETQERTLMMLMDMNSGALLGCNRAFLSALGCDSDGAAWLGKPVSELISPTPLEWQQERLSRLPPADLSPVKAMPAESLERISTGCRCFRRIIATEKEDFDFRTEVMVRDGTDFYALLGRPSDVSAPSPDEEGYFFGLEGTSGRPVIKRRGFIAARGEKPLMLTGKLRLEVIKRGNAMVLHINGARQAGLEDPLFLHHPEGMRLCVMARRRADTHGSLSLEVFPSGKREASPASACRALKGGQGTYHFEPFYSTSLSGGRFQHVGGFLLHDVTELEKRAQALASSLARKQREAQRLRQQILGHGAPRFIGQSPAAVRLREQALRAADSGAVVLITGATGTGKEVLARFIHGNGPGAEGPFVKADMGSLPETLILSELFGHRKGAFTGADRDRPGLAESAAGGTLFLDEIANLPPGSQGALLRFLNDGSFVPLGSDQARTADARIILATNADLKALVHRGLFREDLYYRIHVITLRVPDLSERAEDIPLLAAHALENAGKTAGRSFRGFTSEALRRLSGYPWPGNIRQLFSAVQRAAIMASGERIDVSDLELPEGPGKVRKSRTPYRVGRTDPELIRRAMADNAGVVKAAAESLGIDRRTLYLFLRSKGWKAEEFRTGLPGGPGKI